MDKVIQEPEAVLKLITALFGKLPVLIRYFDKELPCKIVALKNKALVINNSLTFETKERILSVLHNGSRISVFFNCAGSDGNGIEILAPLKVLITEAKRGEARVEVSKQGNAGYTVTNLINVNEIAKAIGFVDKKVDAVLETYRTKIAKDFKNSQIFFNERPDNRLRLIHKYDKSIFVIDRKNKATANPAFFPFDEYQRIFSSSTIMEEIISEICIPIKYKGYMDIGYIQVLSETPLDTTAFNQIMVYAGSLSRDIIATGLFQESKETCPVIDLSVGGISFVHPNTRTFARTMTLNVNTIFDVVFSPTSKVSFRGIIKNIRNQENDFRVGCQFYNLNPKETQFLQQLLVAPAPETPKTEGEAEIESEPVENTEPENSGDQKEENPPTESEPKIEVKSQEESSS